MKRPKPRCREIAELLAGLDTGSISPQDAMTRLVPHILDGANAKQHAEAESAKEYIMGRIKQKYSHDTTTYK